MNRYSSHWISWALTQVIILIAFTVLSIIFQKWWIILFALLFTSYVKTEEKTTARTCDKCGTFIYFKTDNQTKEYEEAGWKRMKENGVFIDVCPNCLRKEEINASFTFDSHSSS